MSKDKDSSERAEKVLSKIEKSLKKISEQQEAICSRLAQLESRLEAGVGSAGPAISHDELVTFLDQFRAGEALGEASLGAWIEASDTDCVRGGLRTVQQREGMHARLLEARMKELGATPAFELPEAVQEQVMKGAADPDKTDAEKLSEFVARFPDIDAALKPIHDIADRLDHDQETQFLLRTIAQDERSTLEFITSACQQLNG